MNPNVATEKVKLTLTVESHEAVTKIPSFQHKHETKEWGRILKFNVFHFISHHKTRSTVSVRYQRHKSQNMISCPAQKDCQAEDLEICSVSYYHLTNASVIFMQVLP